MSTVRPRLLFSTLNPPWGGHGGGTNTASALVHKFLECGFDVVVAYLSATPESTSPEQHAKAVEGLTQRGVSAVIRVDHPIDLHRQSSVKAGMAAKVMNRLRFSPDYIRPWHQAGERIKSVLDEVRPDICFLYGFEAMAAFLDVKTIPKIGSFGVMPYKLKKVRLRTLANVSPIKAAIKSLDFGTQLRHELRNVRELAASVSGVIAFCANEADECRRVAGTKTEVLYLPNLIPDEGEGLSRITPWVGPSEPHRVVIAGHLRGTATLSGHSFFIREIIPALKRRGWFDRMQFDIIGKFEPPPWLKAGLSYPNVRFTGFVEDFATAVHTADVYLVAIPDDVGNRTRIASAWALKCCVVSHVSSQWGMPEMKDGENCLLGVSGDEVADALIRACTDGALSQRLRNAGRVSFDTYYNPKVAFSAIEAFVRAKLPLRD